MADEIVCPKCSAPNPRDTVFCGKCGARVEDISTSEGGKDPLIGAFVGDRFLIHERLGEGGMGVVYRSEQTAIQREVALKVLHTHLNQDESLYARFRNEAAACSRLTHPNTITIFDFGKTDTGSLYIAMEFIKGRSLDDEIRSGGAIAPHRVCNIGLQICGSLRDAHENNIVHRDLKPENVMLCKRGDQSDVVKVLDFGIAKIMEDNGQDQRKALTKTGMVFGTPQYMSPEQIRGEKVDSRTDIYSLGVILYEMTTGVLPFTADAPMGVLTKHLMDNPPPFSATIAPVSPELESVVRGCLAKDPSERPASMKTLADMLRTAANAFAGVPPPSSQTMPMPAPGASASSALPQTVAGAQTFEDSNRSAPTPSAGSISARPSKDGSGLKLGVVIAAVVLLLGGGALGAYFFFFSGTTGEGPQGLSPPGAIAPPTPSVPASIVPTAPTLSGQDTAATQAPALLPAVPATDTAATSDKGETSSAVAPKRKDAACRFKDSGDVVARAIKEVLKKKEKAIKKCTIRNGGGTTELSFAVKTNESRPSSIKMVKTDNNKMGNCLKRLFDVDFQKKNPALRTGTAKFEVSRKGGAVSDCVIFVRSRTNLIKNLDPVKILKPLRTETKKIDINTKTKKKVSKKPAFKVLKVP